MYSVGAGTSAMAVPLDRTCLAVLPCLMWPVLVVGVAEQAVAQTHTYLAVPASGAAACLLELSYEGTYVHSAVGIAHQ